MACKDCRRWQSYVDFYEDESEEWQDGVCLKFNEPADAFDPECLAVEPKGGHECLLG